MVSNSCFSILAVKKPFFSTYHIADGLVVFVVCFLVCAWVFFFYSDKKHKIYHLIIFKCTAQ